MRPIKCKNCPAEIEQLPSGSWATLEGFCYCKKRIGNEAPMLHEPNIPLDWIESIRSLAAHSVYWTKTEIARLMQLPESVIEEILNGKESTD